MAIDYPNSVDVQEVNDEIWFDIVNRTITLKEGQDIQDILVQNDANSRNFGFMIQRYFEMEDLSTKNIRIHYVNSLNQSDFAEAHTIELTGENEEVLSFQWLIGAKVCLEIGDVKFAIEFWDNNGYALFTTPMMVTVSESIYSFGTIPDPEDGWYKMLMNKIENATPKLATISLLGSNWNGDVSPYSQVATVNSVTETSRIDLQPTPNQLAYFQKEEISLLATNENGIVTVYAIGEKPTDDLSLQVMITEVKLV